MKNKLQTHWYGTKNEAIYAVNRLKTISNNYYGFIIKNKGDAFRVEYKSKDKKDYWSTKKLLANIKRSRR